MRALVTGGAGFIGSELVHQLMARGDDVTVVDKMTYAASRASLAAFDGHERFHLICADICDAAAMAGAFEHAAPDTVFHLAAETHVDRSIDGAGAFIETNLIGTYTLLQAARAHRDRLGGAAADAFRFLHISTDEVFGELGPTGTFNEATAYDPSSPYSASKAGSDHLVRAWGRTYGLGVLVSNCSNNYGPRQFPEKLIPLVILNAIDGHTLPIYGDGSNVRDWLYVGDHVSALLAMAARAATGATYCVGGKAERSNLAVVQAICAAMDVQRPDSAPHDRLIEFVTDRPGHDQRYAIDTAQINADLGWAPTVTFEAGLAKTVDWYLANEAWWAPLRAQVYAGERLGQG